MLAPRTLHVFHGRDHEVILSGNRPTGQSLWQVDLHPHRPEAHAPTHTATGGMHIEAHHIGEQDAASFVRFVHAYLRKGSRIELHTKLQREESRIETYFSQESLAALANMNLRQVWIIKELQRRNGVGSWAYNGPWF